MAIEYSTHGLREDQGFAYWHEVVCRHCIPAACQPLDASPFEASLSVSETGKVAISTLQAPLHRWRRRACDVRTGPDEDFWVASIENGSGHMEQNGRQALLSTGSLVFYDATRPFACTLEARRVYLVRLPRQSLLRRCPRAERLGGQPLDETLPGAAPLRTLIQQARDLERPANDRLSTQFGDTLLDLAAMALECRLIDEPDGEERDLYARLVAYIQANFEDPSLSLETLASAHHVSRRTVTRACARHGRTAMSMVWQTRLQLARRTLEQGRASSVTEVAFSHGFTSLSHFNRSFREAFGCTPGAVLSRPTR